MSDSLVWVVALPLAGALLSLLRPGAGSAIGLATVLGTVAAAVAATALVVGEGVVGYTIGGWSPGLGIALRADGLSVLLLLMTALVALAISIQARVYFGAKARQRPFWALWLLLLTALNALYLAADLFNLYVTLELMGLSAVALVALGGSRAALEAALRYLMLGLLGSLAYLAGVALIYAGYGVLDIPLLAQRIEPDFTSRTAAALMTVGLLVKTALLPLHFWLPPAHGNAPAPVSAALSALVVKAAFYLVLRLWLELFAPITTGGLAWLWGGLGAAAVLWGSWRALRAERLKLLAAYSTVAQIGYLFMFLPLIMQSTQEAGKNLALGAVLLMALTHGFAKSGLFLATGVIQRRMGHDRIRELGGIAQSLPVTSFALALAGVALIGLPPSGAFLGKWQLIAGSMAAGHWLWVAVVSVGSLLAAAYVFRLLSHAFGESRYPVRSLASGREELPALSLGLVATLVLGLAAGPLWPLLETSVNLQGGSP